MRLRAEARELNFVLPRRGLIRPTLPTGSSWADRGRRTVVFQEGTSGRRVNALGALRADGDQPRLIFRTTTGKATAEVLLDFLCVQIAGLPGVPDTSTAPSSNQHHRPCTIVLDNASTHISRRVKDAGPLLERHRGV